jgi:hypothetical protein
MTDDLTVRVIRELNAERDRQERAKAGHRLAVLPSPPPASEVNYSGAWAPSAPIDDGALEGEPSEPAELPFQPDWLINPASWEGTEVPQREWSCRSTSRIPP